MIKHAALFKALAEAGPLAAVLTNQVACTRHDVDSNPSSLIPLTPTVTLTLTLTRTLTLTLTRTLTLTLSSTLNLTLFSP